MCVCVCVCAFVREIVDPVACLGASCSLFVQCWVLLPVCPILTCRQINLGIDCSVRPRICIGALNVWADRESQCHQDLIVRQERVPVFISLVIQARVSMAHQYLTEIVMELP